MNWEREAARARGLAYMRALYRQAQLIELEDVVAGLHAALGGRLADLLEPPERLESLQTELGDPNVWLSNFHSVVKPQVESLVDTGRCDAGLAGPGIDRSAEVAEVISSAEEIARTRAALKVYLDDLMRALADAQPFLTCRTFPAAIPGVLLLASFKPLLRPL